jgi:WD40 repeat protein
LAFSPDGRQALLANSDGMVRVWDVENGKEVRRLDHGEGLTSVTCSPKGRYAVTAGGSTRDGKALLRLWDVEQGKEVRRFEGHPGWVYHAVFSPDGRHVLSGSSDRTLRLWDVETGKEVRRFSGHARRVWHVAFSPDGRRALSAAWDGSVRLWDVGAAKELQTFGGDPAGGAVRLFDFGKVEHEPELAVVPVQSRRVAFSPDGRQALSAWADGTVRLWRVPPEEER